MTLTLELSPAREAALKAPGPRLSVEDWLGNSPTNSLAWVHCAPAAAGVIAARQELRGTVAR